MVRNVKQDRNGNILIASYLGVFRYDGTSFTNLTSKISSPRFSSFWDVLEDRKENLWFASKDSGIYYYNGKSFQHFTTKDGLASNLALHIYEDKKGNIWTTGSNGSAGQFFGDGSGRAVWALSRYDAKGIVRVLLYSFLRLFNNRFYTK